MISVDISQQETHMWLAISYIKIFNISNQSGNTSQDHSELTPNPNQNGHHLKVAAIDIKNRELFHLVGVNVNW
jgi:hypothetical protein